MAIADDFTVTVAGDIRHAANTGSYTVLELHRWLQDLADDEYVAVDGDYVDITSLTPSERKTDNIIDLLNGYNIDDEASKYFYGGSVSQCSGATLYAGLRVLGAVNDTETQLMIIQDHDYYPFVDTPSTTPFWGTQSAGGYNGNAAGGVLMRICLKARHNGADIDGKNIRIQARQWGDSYDFFNVELGEGEAVGAIGTTPDAQNTTDITSVQSWDGTGNEPTNTEGYQQIDILNGNGDFPYYSQWTYASNTAYMSAIWEWIKEITGNNSPEAAEPHGMNGELFLGPTHSWDFDGATAGTTGYATNEILSWGTTINYSNNTGDLTAGDLIVIGSNGATGRINYSHGTATGTSFITVALDDPSVLISAGEVFYAYKKTADYVSTGEATVVSVVANTASGGTGQVLATTGGTAGTTWIQLLTGNAPEDGLLIKGHTTSADGTTTGAASIKTVPKVALGSYTGSLIGAYGIGILPANLLSTDTVTPLVGATQNPPNNVTFSLSGVEIGEDRILIGKKDSLSSNFDFDELIIATALSGVAETALVVNLGTIPSDCPQTGTLRVTLDDGTVYRQEFTAHDGSSTFTIPATDYSSANATSGNGTFISFLDLLATADPQEFTVQFDAARTLWVRVRDGGATPIKTYEAQATLGSTGGNATATRISDA